MENSNWRTVKLGEYASFLTGKLDSNAATLNGAYPFFTCSRETFRTDTFSFDTECVLLAGNNAAGIFPLKYFVGKFDAYQRTYIIEPLDRTKLSTRFLYYVLRLQLEYMKSISTGAATKFLTKTILDNLEITIPEFETQRRIADILSAYDDLIENNTRRIRIMEQMAQVIYQEWFGKVDKESLPEGWEIGKLEDALVLQRGFDLPIQDRKDGDVPIYAATGITGFHNEAKVKAPGIVTGRSGSLGTVIYIDKDFWALNTTLWVKEFRRVTPLFAYYLLSDLKLEQFNSGAAVPTLNRNDIHGMPVIIPSSDILQKFDEVVLPMYSLASTLRSKNANLRQTRDLLLPRLVSGDIEVSELNDD